MKRLLSCVLALGAVACAQSSPLVASGTTVERSTTTNTKFADAAHAPLDVPALPQGKATLTGGTIQTVDHLRDRLVLQVFGGRRMAVLFDERTRVYRGDKVVSLDELKNGDRVYVDTMLDGTTIFARNIRVASEIPSGSSSGQIVNFEPASGELTLRDSISPTPVKMRLASDAVILEGDRPAQKTQLRAGALVTVEFMPDSKGPAKVRKLSIQALPGAVFAFSGRVEYLDLHRGVLVVVDPRDNKSYQVEFDPATRIVRDVHEGSEITVTASFDGRRYAAQSITKNPASQ